MQQVPVIRLEWYEVIIAAMVGVLRRVDNLRRGRLFHPAHGIDEASSWQADIDGALGEAAVAKYFNVWWSGNIGYLDAPDVGPLQVRTTSARNGNLLLYPSDRDHESFILVHASLPYYRLSGWIRGGDGKRKDLWGELRPGSGRESFIVPPGMLQPVATLGSIRELA